jgi:hypothetical protein
MGVFGNIFGTLTRTKRSLRDATGPADSAGNRRTIKTGRTVDAINEAARNGFRPLVKPVTPGKHIHNMVGVFQDPASGQIAAIADSRGRSEGLLVIPWTHYYPYSFPNPFAAYLLPSDLGIWEEVWLEDLIEDLVAVWGNQGDHPRLPAAGAIWNGKDFEILFDPRRDAEYWIG